MAPERVWGFWSGLSPDARSTCRAQLLPLSAHQPHRPPLHLGSKASPRGLGPGATPGTAAPGPAGSSLWIPWSPELKTVCEAPKHTHQTFLLQGALCVLGKCWEPTSSLDPPLQMVGMGFVLSDPQSNRKFYHPSLPHFGGPGGREGCTPLARSLLC